MFSSRIIGASAFVLACVTLYWPSNQYKQHLLTYFGAFNVPSEEMRECIDCLFALFCRGHSLLMGAKESKNKMVAHILRKYSRSVRQRVSALCTPDTLRARVEMKVWDF